MITADGKIIGINYEKVSVESRDISRAVFLDNPKMMDSSVTRYNFKNVTIVSPIFENVRFISCIFDNCKFIGGTLRLCTFTSCSLQNADFSKSHMTSSNINRCNITNLKGVDKEEVKFVAPNLVNPLIREEVGDINSSTLYDKFNNNIQLGTRMHRISGLISEKDKAVVTNRVIVTKEKSQGVLGKTIAVVNSLKDTVLNRGKRKPPRMRSSYETNHTYYPHHLKPVQRHEPYKPLSRAAHVYFSDESVFTKGKK
jgi:hypothetical protein